jgi:hypothetical protein
MSGALGNIFGGGNILGLVMNIASIAFPPMAIATSLANLVGGAVGQALSGAVDQMMQQQGMPKFLGEAVKQMAEKVIQGLTKESDAQADQATQGAFGEDMQKLTDELTDAIVKGAQAIMQQDKGDGKSSKANGKGGSGKTASSWLEAIALAMGEAAGNKAAKMVELSNKLKELSSAGGSEKDQQKAAKEMNAVNAQFQAVSQEFNMLQSAFSTAIKSLGEGLAQMARKT